MYQQRWTGIVSKICYILSNGRGSAYWYDVHINDVENSLLQRSFIHPRLSHCVSATQRT